MKQTAKTDQRQKVILRKGQTTDGPHCENQFLSGIIDRIYQLAPHEASIAAALVKLSLQDDEIGKTVRKAIAETETTNCQPDIYTCTGLTSENIAEIHFWNGIISGIELAEYRKQPKLAV